MPRDLPTVVAIDTATEVCSVAVLQGNGLIELAEDVGQRHSERVLPMINAALVQAGLKLSQVDVVAFGAGPGSFTGLRIACGIAQGLAYGTGKRVVPVGNLRALAANAFGTTTHGDMLLAAVDARMNEVYCAVYRRDEHVSEARAPALEHPHALEEIADEVSVDIVAGNALTKFSMDWLKADRWIALPQVAASAGSIARLARMDAASGLTVAPEQAAPQYVRDQVALTIEQRRGASAARIGASEGQICLAESVRSASPKR